MNSKLKVIVIFMLIFSDRLSLSLHLNLNHKSTVTADGKKYQLPKLPYAYNALEPYIDAKTMEIHYTKHHQAYADNLNNALQNNPELQGKPLEYLLTNIELVPVNIRKKVQNNAGGHANHSMFWLMMAPKKAKAEPQSELAKHIAKQFGSFKNFKEKFDEAAKGVFGSGWAWLCVDQKGDLKIITTEDQDSPISMGLIPVLGLDVWEHAYYLKYQNRRAEYVTQWWNVVNWPYVEESYNKALEQTKPAIQ